MSSSDRTVPVWSWTRRLLQLVLAILVAAAVFVIASRGSDGAEPVLPDTATAFSLDMTVVGSADLDTIYVVEQRARPAYRIFAFDPTTGAVETLFSVPDDAIVYGIALSPDHATLAVAYTPDHRLNGNGLWTLDLQTKAFERAIGVEPGVYLTELDYGRDGSVLYATHVDRRGTNEALSIAELDPTAGTVQVIVERAITPAVADDDLYYLAVDDDQARRRIETWSGTEHVTVGDGSHDLDHLVAVGGTVRVAVLDTTDPPTLSIGEVAGAHGNHTVASTWHTVEGSRTSPMTIDPIITYDAILTDDGTIVEATLEGLAVSDNERIDLIASRALRFVAA